MELDFHELEKKIVKNQHTICISAGFPFHTLGLQVAIFQYTIYKNFIGLQRSMGQLKHVQLQISKNHKKTTGS